MTTSLSKHHTCVHKENGQIVVVAYDSEYCPLCRAEDEMNQLRREVERLTELPFDEQIAVNER
jgi:hypothetical protein